MDEIEKKSKFNYLKAYHEIRKALDKVNKGRINQLTIEQLDIIGETFTLYKNETTIINKLTEAGLSKYDIDELFTTQD
jgi:CRISPR-associated endonuclease Csn1